MLQVQNVCKTFHGGRGTLEVLRDIRFNVAAGEFISIIGPSGCGKTTLLRILHGLEPATRGVVSVSGKRVEAPSPSSAMVFQQFNLFPWLTVARNIAFGLEVAVIIWLGLGFEAKVFLTWLVSVFPVIINAQIGVMNVPPAFIETARAFGCDRWQLFRRVILQAAVPFLIAGIRLGLGRALVGVVVAEMFTALTGLGSMIVFYGNTFRTAELFVPMVVLAILSVVITNLIYRVEVWIAPWRMAQG